MLVSKNNTIAINDVVSLKLTSGEEIVGRVTAVEDGITITKPIHIVAVMQPNGQAAIQFAPFLYSAPEDANFHFTAAKLALAPIKARADITKNYLEATSSIALPPKNGLVLP